MKCEWSVKDTPHPSNRCSGSLFSLLALCLYVCKSNFLSQWVSKCLLNSGVYDLPKVTHWMKWWLILCPSQHQTLHFQPWGKKFQLIPTQRIINSSFSFKSSWNLVVLWLFHVDEQNWAVLCVTNGMFLQWRQIEPREMVRGLGPKQRWGARCERNIPGC